MLKNNEQLLMEQRIREQVGRLREQGWLVFTGPEALNVMRKTYLYSGDKPILCVGCQRGPNRGPHEYEYFLPNGASFDLVHNHAVLSGTIGRNGAHQALIFDPNKAWGESGTVVSYVYTLPQYFPRCMMQMRVADSGLVFPKPAFTAAEANAKFLN